MAQKKSQTLHVQVWSDFVLGPIDSELTEDDLHSIERAVCQALWQWSHIFAESQAEATIGQD